MEALRAKRKEERKGKRGNSQALLLALPFQSWEEWSGIELSLAARGTPKGGGSQKNRKKGDGEKLESKKGTKERVAKKIEGEKVLLESLGKKFTRLRGSRPQSYSDPLSSLSSSQSKDSASSSLSGSTEPPSPSSELAESSPLTTRPLTNDVDSWVDGHSALLAAKSSRRGGHMEPTHSVVSGRAPTDSVLSPHFPSSPCSSCRCSNAKKATSTLDPCAP